MEKKLKKSLDAKIILNASGDELEFIKSVEPELKNVFIVSVARDNATNFSPH